MVSLLADIGTAFVLGLLTPLTAVCVLPLYPGFLSYLANKLEGRSDDRKLLAMFGVVVVTGVIIFMLLLGLIFTTILKASLTNIIGIISPIAFGVLGIISIFLIFNVEFARYIPKPTAPILKSPLASAFVFGFFFGAIVIPCNPLFIAALFTQNLVSMGFAANLLSFLSFGIGIGFPLLLFSVVSAPVSGTVIGFLQNYKRHINLVSGIVMLAASLYYLIFVFKVFAFITG